jgi:hypothetical protein
MAKPKHFQRLAKRYPDYVRAVEKLGAAVRYFMRDMVGVPALFVLMMQTRAAACRELVAPAPLT